MAATIPNMPHISRPRARTRKNGLSCGAETAAGAPRVDSVGWVTAPHCVQNWSPTVRTAPHDGHRISSAIPQLAHSGPSSGFGCPQLTQRNCNAVPQFMQNRLLDGFMWPQFRQCIEDTVNGAGRFVHNGGGPSTICYHSVTTSGEPSEGAGYMAQTIPAGRDERGIVAQLDPIFRARSVAVVGASNTPGKWGFNIMRRILGGNYQGNVYPLHPQADEVQGLKAYRRLADLPERVDLAVLAVPAPQIPAVLRECIAAGVGGALVITAGFAESSADGAVLQEEVVDIARQGGIRFIGPNCLGIWSSAVRLSIAGNATRSGSIAFVSQSGAFGASLMALAEAKGYGLSKFISSGNQADLNVADYLEYLVEDEDTRVIVLYIEGVPEGRRFLDVAKEVAKRKPIVVYKAGRTSVGERAVRSHTASLMVSDAVFDGVCAQAGLVRVQETSRLFDIAEALSTAPLPKGRGVGIVSMTGGNAVVSSDTCAYLGLDVPELDAETQAYFRREVLADHAPTPRNPIDLAGDFSTPLLHARCAETMAGLDYIHGIIITPPSGSDPRALEAVQRIAAIPKTHGKPVLALGRRNVDDPATKILIDAGVPMYQSPEDGAYAMRALVTYAEARSSIR